MADTTTTTAAATPSTGHGLNACQKVLIHHAAGLRATPAYIPPDEVLLLKPSWLLCSEAAWNSMETNYNALGRPAFRRKDRFWLAPDHIVDPRVNQRPRERGIIEKCERIAKEMDLGDNYNPPNTTIMHTDFYRKRCLPGQLVIGADSHTGSAGALGALAIGMGITDVLMQIVTGETFLKMPEVLCIRFTGQPPLGVGGKDVILGVLGQLRRNTAAAERLVEFTGEGLRYLSCDARFAICNMVTELGGIGALVVPDAVTAEYVARRPPGRRRNQPDAVYFRPDAHAQYAAEVTIDLATLDHFVALYPSPDNVVPVARATLPPLQGTFVGACTTTEEDLILGGLVLREGLKAGMRPAAPGLRRVTPGSLGIVNKLRRIGLLQVYEEAGFVVGAPGCSYCVGMGIDKAGKGEVWLSSQNRNYRDRMGPGSIANLASAATVAASSFTMTLQNPQPLLDRIDFAEYDALREYTVAASRTDPVFAEPQPTLVGPELAAGRTGTAATEPTRRHAASTDTTTDTCLPATITATVQRFGDNVDTDSIAPTEICIQPTDASLARGAFLYTRPDFYARAQAGASVVVAGHAFGTGSSREQAPKALLAAGIQAVVARSFAFIYGRNQANSGLLGIKVQDDAFYERAAEGTAIAIDLAARTIRCGAGDGDGGDGTKDVFPFQLDPIEERLLAAGGLLKMYDVHGAALFERLQAAAVRRAVAGPVASESKEGLAAGNPEANKLAW
ncbi:Aconitase/3-isopropylmalate dehydratase large subunit, alpha/beta/alpha [Niveomyces insectorum RCEF 264]|uniref:Aconitase/3-isopropylmalate dehydratase large subunit, alpha/beta/alpha n=1 Tax=Niveomyces insectorum RCEF 264 TaxID=1081102 RepID=A0A167UKF6_9HYPO|nr:Aconitase/3-isopropylmalate dehydratase large subunit, alpha/beta/alpha [Niveomyces insectorum RCEF 264]